MRRLARLQQRLQRVELLIADELGRSRSIVLAASYSLIYYLSDTNVFGDEKLTMAPLIG